MGSITSSVGLITGIEIDDTVAKLMSLAKIPRNNLQTRTEALELESTALDQLGSLLLAFQYSAISMNSSSNYSSTNIESSNTALLTATANGDIAPQAGTYTFTALQTATTHQVVSNSFTDVESQLSSGTFAIGVGGHIDGGIDLSELNSGSGFNPGIIKITDRSGTTSEVDLRAATTIDDVLDAINSNSDFEVTASIDGDSIVLTDDSGGTGNLRVREVGLGTTAASLGLSGINVAADTVTGSDVYDLYSGTLLSSLNDGNGVQIHTVGDALTFTLSDASEVEVDLSGAGTLGDVIDAINDAGGGNLTAAIASDGQRLEITDNTGTGTFEVTGTGTLVEDLGLGNASASGVISGERLISGLKDTLLSSLNGGQGVGDLTTIDITDSTGAVTAGIDLSSAETLSDVVNLINNSGADVTVSINSSRNGLVITDTSGGSGNFVISSTDSTADSLGIAVDDAVESINTGSLNRQVVSESTLLSEFNGGTGVRLGDFRITDSTGKVSAVSLDTSGAEAETIGDVIDAINALSVGVEARINDTGDGILITDTAGGAGTLTIADINGNNAASDLRIATASSDTNEGGQQIIDGRTSFSIDLSELEVSEGIALSSLNDGNGVNLGVVRVTASNGEIFHVQLGESGNEAFTVQDVIDKFNDAATAEGINVTASLNASGTGLQLVDSEGGIESLTVEDLGSGNVAAVFQLTNDATKNTNTNTQTIFTVGVFEAEDQDKTALEALAEKINDFGGGFTASTFYDGTGYRLSITSENTGVDHELLVDSSQAGFSTQDVTKPKDAVLQYGNTSTGGIVVTSDDNSFDNVVQGLSITVTQASSEAVTVEVDTDTSKLVSSVQNFVDSFNSLREAMDALTAYDEETESTGILFGRSEVLRIETDLSRVLTGVFKSSSKFKTLEGIGISFTEDGELELDSSVLSEALEENPSELQQFLTQDGIGVIDSIQSAVNRLAGEDTSLLSLRYDALAATIEVNNTKIERMDVLLNLQEERIYNEFYALEEVVASLQSNLDLLDSIQYIDSSGNSSSN